MTDWSSSVASGTPKPACASMPAAVRARVEREVGAVESVTTQPGGFTPSVAVRVRLAGGGSVFVKAADGGAYPEAAQMHRTEAGLLADLVEVAQAPDLVTWFEQDGWTVLVLQEIDGRHPHLPWRDEELTRTLDGLVRLSETLTPSPVTAPPVGRRWGTMFDGWRQLREAPAALDDLDGVGSAWVGARVEELAAVEERWLAVAGGDTLLHADLRADQILLTDDGIRVVDWPHACVGAAWLDPLFLFPSVTLQGGPAIGQLVRRCSLTAEVPHRQLVTAAVAMAGFFLHRSSLPDPPGLPTLRAFQRAQGEVLARWLQTAWDAR